MVQLRAPAGRYVGKVNRGRSERPKVESLVVGMICRRGRRDSHRGTGTTRRMRACQRRLMKGNTPLGEKPPLARVRHGRCCLRYCRGHEMGRGSFVVPSWPSIPSGSHGGRSHGKSWRGTCGRRPTGQSECSYPPSPAHTPPVSQPQCLAYECRATGWSQPTQQISLAPLLRLAGPKIRFDDATDSDGSPLAYSLPNPSQPTSTAMVVFRPSTIPRPIRSSTGPAWPSHWPARFQSALVSSARNQNSPSRAERLGDSDIMR
jgi:hypothetical protein